MQPILTVDLTSGAIDRYDLPPDWEQLYLGGASLAARILYDALTPKLDPLSPEAPLLFLNGPLSGTAGPAVGRFVVCARSPATGLWGESNCGGFWGPELRMAGYAGVLITGRAERPVVLWVDDDRVQIRPAGALWGSDPYTCQTRLAEDLGKVRVAAIGLAGEARLPYALILCDHGRVAGRTGMGAVMGAKHLKAIAVRGSGKVPVVDAVRYLPLRSEANRLLRSDAMSMVVRELGTAGVADYFDYLGSMPKRYFQSGEFEGVVKLSGSTIKETISSGISACHGCVIACGRKVRLEDGVERKGPEYETLVGFGPNLEIDDPAAVVRMGEWADRYGMDTISLSNVIGLAFMLYAQGKITEEDTGGLALRWGDAAAAESLIHLTVRREGIGAYLAQGAFALAQHFGDPDEAVQVNNLELPYHDPRGVSGMALVYATSPRGGCHNQSDYFLVDVGQADPGLNLKFLPRQSRTVDEAVEKAANVARHQDWRSLCNALVLCLFANVPPEAVLGLVNAACGLDWSLAEMLQAGERAWTLKRVINNRLGLTRANDKLPKAFSRPYAEGGAAGYVPDLGTLLMAYYSARGWEEHTGYPTAAKLAELGLDWVSFETG